MARDMHPNRTDANVIADGDFAFGQRTIGSLLGQMELAELSQDQCLRILRSVGLPARAFEDPTFPISPEQDLEMLGEVVEVLGRQQPDMPMVSGLFALLPHLHVQMFGALGLAWQCAPTLYDAVELSVRHAQLNWGRSRMIVSTGDDEGLIEYQIDSTPTPRAWRQPEHATKAHLTRRYALLLDIVATAAIILDIAADPSVLRSVRLPFSKPHNWSDVAPLLPFSVQFRTKEAALVLHRDFLSQEPKRAHRLSFRLAMQLVEKESAILTEDVSLTDRVTRWLWAYTPPLKKVEIASLLGVSERSLTRRLASEGSNYNALFAAVQSERAQNLLLNPNLTVAEIAYRMGYSDPSAFTRAFASWEGVSPSQWRTMA